MEAALKQANLDRDVATKALADLKGLLAFKESKLAKATGTKYDALAAEIEDIKYQITLAQRAADNAEGAVAQADAAQKAARRVKEEMAAIQ